MSENIWRGKWSKDQIKTIFLEQTDNFWNRDTGIPRLKLKDVEQAASLPHTVIISGLRRVGKSTMLAQMAHKLGREAFYYINFEDDRFLGFQADDANYLYELLVEFLGERKIFLVDEIQNINGWEYFVRRFMDMGFKFYITGSNASLLSCELGTRLTGRYVPIELFPFSFAEYLHFRGEELPDLTRMTTVERARLNASLDAYLKSGGIPEAITYPDLPLLKTLYDDVLYRDIATRYHIEAVAALKELAFYLISNPANLISFNKLKEQYRLGSVNTIKSYVEYLQNSWLVFIINAYDYSLKRQQVAAKKIYCIDTGFTNTVGFSFSPNRGKLLENIVFLELRRQSKALYYNSTASGYEVDFYLPEKGEAIQVVQNLDNPSTRERELRALEDIIRGRQIKKALILSDHNEDEFKIGSVPVEVRSIAEWLLL